MRVLGCFEVSKTPTNETVNHWVAGSSPAGGAKFEKALRSQGFFICYSKKFEVLGFYISSSWFSSFSAAKNTALVMIAGTISDR